MTALTDTNGRAFALAKDIKPGDWLTPDDGFTCMRKGRPRKIMQSMTQTMGPIDPEYLKEPISRLYIQCSCKRHFLDGQIGDHGELIGLYPTVVEDWS